MLVLRIFGLPREGRAEAARLLADLGFAAVVVNAAEAPEDVRPALDVGLAVWGCRAAFSVKELPAPEVERLLARDADGRPQRWFDSGCPNQPQLRASHIAAVMRVVHGRAFAGFLLDGIRFASPTAGPDAYFTCFCDACRARAAELGFDFERMRLDVAALRDHLESTTEPLAPAPGQLGPAFRRWPGVQEWLGFRAACVSEHVRELRAAIDGARATGQRFQLGAYLFVPSFAPLVGQDYVTLAHLLDSVSPMIYRTLEGDACLVAEWAALVKMRLIPSRGEFAAEDVGTEARRARELLPAGTPLQPILQLDDTLVGATTRAAVDAGADALDYFRFLPGREAHTRATASAYRAALDGRRPSG